MWAIQHGISYAYLSFNASSAVLAGCRYIQNKDLEFFKERVEQPGDLKGAGPWEHMVYKDFGSFTYEAWRRSLAVSFITQISKGAWLLVCMKSVAVDAAYHPSCCCRI